MRLSFAVLALSAVVTAASAQDRDNRRLEAGQSAFFSYELGAGTDNRSKGASKSGNEPYAFGEVQWNATNGFYADAEFETIDSSGSRVETEVEAGWQYSIAGFDFDTSASHKWRVGADAGHDDAAWEFQFDVMRDFGDLDTRLRVEHSPDGLGSTEAWTWYEARLRYPLADNLQGSVSLGRREQDNSPDYTSWNAGVAYSLNSVTALDLRWHDTNIEQLGEQYEDALVASVLVKF